MEPNIPATGERIDPQEVMRRYTVEELSETADEYFRRIPDPTPLMCKPFAFLHETPEMLQNLGLLLSGLHLGKTMTVLDFGAGTCWLARLLTQLDCRVVCCDTSPAALEIGKRLFGEYPLIGNPLFTPRFLPFDGHRIDLADASIDRVVCFDAFHHVPNPSEVLLELGRVLKDGGIAGFSEPGRRHSHTSQSQYEMRNHRVLENDIDLNAIHRSALPAGFTHLTVKALTDMDLTLDQYNTMFGAGGQTDLRAELWNSTHNTIFNRSIFFLHKGPRRSDSRSHEGLAHSIAITPREFKAAPGSGIRIAATMTNTGTASWLHVNDEIHGTVRLASHLYDRNGVLLNVDYSRHGLPRSIEPGETMTMAIDVPAPGLADYRLAFDLVAEGVTWFETMGSKPVMVSVSGR
jgi:SAM-dependent methyltransferase